MKKNVLLLAYTKKNVGDDLFVSMLLYKYPNVDFTIRNIEENYDEPFKIYKNFKNKIDEETILTIDVTDYNAIIYIGGSVFSETEKNLKKQKNLSELAKKCKKNKIPFYYISSNFGPYKTEEYLEACKETYKNITGITFRDQTSYNMFKRIKSVKYASDMVYSLEIKNKKRIKNSIGISVIHLNFKSRNEILKEADGKYTKELSNKIVNFIKDGKKIYLFSFCKYEGDEVGIKKITDTLPDEYKSKINIVKYNGKPGNLIDFIKKYSMMEMFICTRFHSIILSMLYKQKILIMSYNQKINNLLKDFENEYKIIEINKNLDLSKIKYSDFKDISDSTLQNIIENSKKHFIELDKVLGKTKKRAKINGLPITKRIRRKVSKIIKRFVK